MIKKTMQWMWVLIGIFILPPSEAIAAATSGISVPLVVHIMTDMPMKKEGLVMDSWISESQITNVVLPEVNRIWQPANIQFVVKRIERLPAKTLPDKQPRLDYIVNATRDSRGKANPKRIKKLNRLLDFSQEQSGEVHVYLVPYLGERSQGHAKGKKRRVYLGQWSDKASRGNQPPIKFALTEALPFKHGSLSRTLAHELGHILTLKHPDKARQTQFGLLMGGRKAGYQLTPAEIALARISAAQLVGK